MSVSTKQLSGVQARTRAAILAATATALAANRTATMPEIATVAGVGRTTLHRYFADGETLIYEATLDSIRVLTEAVDEAATDDGGEAEVGADAGENERRRIVTGAIRLPGKGEA
jgi:AcrR family transcriptional regulator